MERISELKLTPLIAVMIVVMAKSKWMGGLSLILMYGGSIAGRSFRVQDRVSHTSSVTSRWEVFCEGHCHIESLDPHGMGTRANVAGLVAFGIRKHHWAEVQVPIQDAPHLAQTLAAHKDVYIAQNRFRGFRRISHLWQLDSLWEISTSTNTPWAGRKPDTILFWVHELLQDAHLPDPTYVWSSVGAGCQPVGFIVRFLGTLFPVGMPAKKSSIMPSNL